MRTKSSEDTAAVSKTWSPGRAIRLQARHLARLPRRTVSGISSSLRDLDSDEGGQTLPFLAIACFGMALMTFMIIHLGQLLSAKVQVQIGADAAALSNAAWIARGMNVQSHLNIAMMLWLTNLIIYRTWWVTILLVTPPLGAGWFAMCEALWFFVMIEMGQWRPLWELNRDTFMSDMVLDGMAGMAREWTAGSGQFYDFFGDISDIEEGLEFAIPGVGMVASVDAAMTHQVFGGSASFGDAPNPYQEGDWANLCHNVPGNISGDGSGIREGDGDQGGWTLHKHDPVLGFVNMIGSVGSHLGGRTLEDTVSRAGGGPGMGGIVQAFNTISSTGGPLFSSYLTAPMLYFLNPIGGQGMYNLAHIQYMMQLPTWYSFFCPDPGMNPLASVPAIRLTDDDVITEPETHSTGRLRRGPLDELFGTLGNHLENHNDWVHGYHLDARPRILREDWYERRYYASIAASHLGGASLGINLPDSKYYDLGFVGDTIGSINFAEAEVYNPHIAPGNEMERVIGMYSPNWRARLRPFELAHLGDNMPIDVGAVLGPLSGLTDRVIMH